LKRFLPVIDTLDKEIFMLLREQAIEAFTCSLAVREFASEKGLENDVERINASIVECKRVLSLANNQISDLREFEMADRVGFFDTVTTL
jgi:hypothetical protein